MNEDYIITDDLKAIHEKCGQEVMKSLLENFPGQQLYIPKLKYSYNYIRRKYNGENIKVLARETGYSISQIYRIIKGK